MDVSNIAPLMRGFWISYDLQRGYFGKGGRLFWQGAILDGKSLTVQMVYKLRHGKLQNLIFNRKILIHKCRPIKPDFLQMMQTLERTPL